MPLELFDYQVKGADFLAHRNRAGLFDEMGIGKTAQAIRAADLRHATRGIVVCPAVARENWKGEFDKFARVPRRVVKGQSIHDFVAWCNGRWDTLVTSYEMATKWAPMIEDRCEPLHYMVFDEGHYMKETETKRSIALLGDDADKRGIQMWAQAAWWLSGTPVPNDPIDIYTFLRFSRAMQMRKKAFKSRYFHVREKTYGTSQTPKIDMLPELHALIGNNSLRRTLQQAAIDLPPIFKQQRLVDGDETAVREMLLKHPGLDIRIKDALESGKGLGALSDSIDHIATLRRVIGEAKAIPYAATLLGELESGLDKMVVFGIHRGVLTAVRDYLARHEVDCVLINGDTSEKERVSAMHRFQTEARCRVMLANIRAAGTALTMTASARLDMLESDWTPANNAQAIKRVHRISQIRTVMVRFITLARSFDVEVNEIVARKAENVAQMEVVAA